jgi:UDP-N-acetylmuramate: L-alanyl-gamma-D-glutamyl-meso-diaminopimelate ligase
VQDAAIIAIAIAATIGKRRRRLRNCFIRQLTIERLTIRFVTKIGKNQMKRIHFIAIGGAIMHQLALALHREGNTITGSDDEIADPARTNLAEAGLLPKEDGWHPERITKDLDAIVLGMHARGDNPELAAAQALGIPVYSFPQYVYEVSKEKKRVVIAGSHGKTTITSMVMHVLKHTGIKFDYLVGAKVTGFNSSVQLSDAPIIILEGDEYPASAVERRPKIFFYHPHISVLSGIAWDHINVFPTFQNYVEQFAIYLRDMEAGSLLLYNDEDSEVKMVVESSAKHLKAVPYCTPKFHYEDGTAVLETATEGAVSVAVFGWHNLLNLEAARGVCNALGVSDKDFYAGIESFTGAARRLERLFEKPGIIAFRDFAHAPSKLKATISAVREALPKQRLIAVFELHTFSSLNPDFLQEYAGAMNAADDAIVFFSHHALELKGLPPLTTAEVRKQFGREDITVVDDKDDLLKTVQEAVSKAPGPKCLLLMSSGTFEGIDWNSIASTTA